MSVHLDLLHLVDAIYPGRLTFYLIYTTKCLGVTGLAQRPNSGSLAMLGFKPKIS